MKLRVLWQLAITNARILRPYSRLLVCLCLLALCCAGGLLTLGVASQAAPLDFTVHEWGTFTAIAGRDGEAVEWSPLRGSTDLPMFVQHFREPLFKLGLRGTIRMETPVLYFYAPRDLTVAVQVRFLKGLVTEWYPHASRVQPKELKTSNLHSLSHEGTIEWNAVTVSPDLVPNFPLETCENHYYAARETSASPLRVQTGDGEQQEKFLFYRGVSAAPLPLSARLDSDGKLHVSNLGDTEIVALVLLERRGDQFGYRLSGPLTKETVLDPPTLEGSADALAIDLEGILVSRGLYPDEAHAMVETWRSSWFEEGSRLIYIVPYAFVDRILPLSIRPAPGQIVRVFVGRVEIVTPTTLRAVHQALASKDDLTLQKYDRFLEPILRALDEKTDGGRP